MPRGEETREPTRPQFTPTARELDDVELLRMSVLGSPGRFGGPESDVRLAVPPDVVAAAQVRGGLEITDAERVPLAVVSVDRTYPVSEDRIGVEGTVRPLRGNSRRAFVDRYLPPSASRANLPPDTITVPVDSPLTSDDLDKIREAGMPVLLLALTGAGTPHGLSAPGLVRATLAAAQELDAEVIAVPVAARPTAARDEAFRKQVVEAYAPSAAVIWPTGAGQLAPAVAAVVERERPSGADRGAVLFLTGLSGSGKSTLAQALCNDLLESGGRTVTLLDGDRVRQNLSRGLTFSRKDRETNIERIAWVAAEVARHGGMVVCCPIAPFDRTRKLARSMAEAVGADFVLVHVATPIETCEARDRKGLYYKARHGEIDEFTGISSPYEEPDDADLTIDTSELSVGQALACLRTFLIDRGWLMDHGTGESQFGLNTTDSALRVP